MKVLHIITGLSNGGAEAVLYRLCKYDKPTRHIVVSLTSEGKYGSLLKVEGVDVFCLNLTPGKFSISALWRLFQFIRKQKPDIVQTWMYHADLIGGIVARLAGVKNLYWNIRHSNLVEGQSKRATMLVAKICAKLSRFVPRKIICCAYTAVNVHVALGYKKHKMIVIGNGYDLTDFYPSIEHKAAFKKELNLSDQVLLGMVGRFDPQKDHFGLLKSIELLDSSFDNFKVALIGNGLNLANRPLVNKIKEYGLESRIVLLDQRIDIFVVMNGLDIHILSSGFGEAFPNVLAEAMACGTPCVATDVGDAAFIIDNTGWVVPPADYLALSHSLLAAIKELEDHPAQWSLRGALCRQRIESNFSIEKMINKYHKAWSE